MTSEEAKELRKRLEEHYGERVAPVSEYCEAFTKYFDVADKYIEKNYPDVHKNLYTLRHLIIGKSCLLKRMIYGGKKPGDVQCPVHKGSWAGMHLGWPGQKWSDGSDVKVSPMLQEWYDQGCRCFKECGCTTGWQPEAKEETSA